MPGRLYRYLVDDHDRLEGLLNQAVGNPGAIATQPYSEFRKGLLRHIGLEEKIMLPAIARLQDGKPAPSADRLRLDHGAIVALLVPSPNAMIVATIRSILQVHNVLEEAEGGVYQLFEQLAGEESERYYAQLKDAPDVPVMPHNDRPGILDVTRRAVARAGYELKEIP